MAKNGAELINVDMSEQDDPAAGKCRIVGDESTGYPAAMDENGVVLPWGSAAVVAPTVLNTDYSVTDADNGSIFDAQGAIIVTLKSGQTAGVRVEFQQTLVGQVTTFKNDGVSTIISEFDELSPVFYAGQGRTVTVTNHGGDVWYISAAQDGSISNGDIPLTIENCVTWYPFDRAATVNGLTADQAPVPDIIDQSTIGEDLNQATASNQAVLNTNAQNALTALRFDQADMYDLTAGQLVWPSGNVTLFAVAWQPQEENNQYVIGMDSTSDDWGIKTNAGEYEYHHGGSIKESSRDTTVPSVIVGSREGTRLRIYNGLTEGGTNTNGSSPTVSNGCLGGRGGTTQRFDGWIGEIIVYNRILTAEERETIVNYLGGKWGVTV